MSQLHGTQPVLARGPSIEQAGALAVLVHGRGATAQNILGLADDLACPEVAYRAPQAAGHSWYPYSFLAPVEHNEPGLSSGLAALGAVLDEATRRGLPAHRQVLIGFSQGACLALEFAARQGRRFGGVIAFTGGLIGERVEPGRYAGGFDGTPVFLGSSDPDPHVPWSRVEESARLFEDRGAAVTLRRYPNLGHTIHPDEIEQARRILAAVSSPGRVEEPVGLASGREQ